MLSLSVGPFALAINHLLLIVALVLATLVGWISGRPQRINPERMLLGLFLLGLLVARLAFVVSYWAQYRVSPLSILDIRDGGFRLWPGVIAILVSAVLLGWKKPAMRTSMGLGVVSGLVFWWLASLVVSAQNGREPLPDLTLRNAAGDAVQLSDYRGKPLVINLWATWCPPCRREMPVLQAAQQANPDVVFLFINQAETPDEVASFFARQGLQLNNVLFDGSGELAQRVGSAALPTTLFYRHDGELSASHLGELSSASLTHYIDSLSGAVAPVSFRSRSTP